ncbi:histone acetyltransferase subunit NuA4-domain-containing protein [Cantharellus anzutake]|uniref:histone acetyltransferase subunit NuA4-domain-containing protein n=1 Tax=Cantharellus anzutake TaxID=1750568 RepID=UPI001904EA66|nr:histone acetyltransferase subunit NuA4-domain-containing protein [Cantharellus anzutake]KAF8327263.1 histone acetyltransferase subunit NuA4-domain-containing protein [Cantharellus anzutake]
MADTGMEAKMAYDSVRKELIQALTKKRGIDKSLATLELQLYNFEGTYLADTTSSGGNIITGFDSYLKTTGSGKKRHDVVEADRIFSNSSATLPRSMELSQQGPPTPTQLDFPATPVAAVSTSNIGPVTVSLTAASSQSDPVSLRKDTTRKRSRRGASNMSDDDDADSSAGVSTRTRPGKRGRID